MAYTANSNEGNSPERPLVHFGVRKWRAANLAGLGCLGAQGMQV